MEVVIVENAEKIGEVAAGIIARFVNQKPDAVLGVATGSSPITTYQHLGKLVDEGKLSLKNCKAFMLDEYVGLPADHPERYRTFIERYFVTPTDIKPQNVHGPDGLADDLFAACDEYERLISEAGGVDIQILGIGTDGHIAFNEPGSSLASRTRLKTLMPQTRQDNARFFDNDINQVPTHALTQGVGTIMSCRHALLVANGEAKAEAIKRIVEGPVTSMWTGSALQLHPHVTIVLDEGAASKLAFADYYRSVEATKVDPQRF